LRAFRVLCCLLAVACSCARRTPEACTAGDLQMVTTGRLTAGVDLSNPPFAFADTEGAPTGFDVDVLKAVAQAMHLKLTVLDRNTPALLPDVLAHRLDVAAAAFRDDSGLPDDVCTSLPYLDADLAVLVRTSDAQTIKSAAALGGRSVAVTKGTAGADWASAHLRGAHVVQVATNDDTVGQVRASAVDAAVLDRAVALAAQMSFPEVHVVADIGIGAHYVMAAAPDTAVTAPLDTALRTIQDDGTLDAIKKRWFGPGA
jgi:ABC-type amino acid transport substrate-binding protein